MTRFIAYFRVSTAAQGRSGLGLEAQREAVARHVAGAGGRIVAEFVEVESGKRADRPELARALAECRAHKAVLLIARLDRLARNVRFIAGLMESGVPFVACDMPNATPFMLHIHAAVAEEEGRAISARTKAALAAARARGVKLGNPQLRAGSPELARAAAAAKAAQARDRAMDLAPIIAEIRAAGVTTLAGIAKALAARGVPTPSGRGAWSPASVLRLERAAPAREAA
ncbi:MAG TPA: recombinase family protein [Acetobacteraceae bacterium]|nr:recombinase family protein [Acetobacteraceae bacterium]